MEGVSQDAILQDEAKMKEINEKLAKINMGSCAQSIHNDLSKGKMIFSEESSRAIYEMGNMELIELRQTSATLQCPSCLMHVPEGLNMCQCGSSFCSVENTILSYHRNLFKREEKRT